MPLTYQVFKDSRLLFIQGRGVITQPERLQTMLAWLADPEYAHCVDAYCDFSGADSTPDVADLRQLVAKLGEDLPASGPRKLAIVAPKPVTFGIARVFQDLIGLESVPIHVKVFFDGDAAWRWLRGDDSAPFRNA